MTDWQLVFLGVMAVSLLVMAIIQVGAIIALLKVGKKSIEAIEDVRRELKPLMEKVNRIADDASRASSLAVIQVERVDRFMASTSNRVADTLGILQTAVAGPASKAAGLVAAVRAGMQVFQYLQQRRQRRSSSHAREEDDALFVG